MIGSRDDDGVDVFRSRSLRKSVYISGLSSACFRAASARDENDVAHGDHLYVRLIPKHLKEVCASCVDADEAQSHFRVRAECRSRDAGSVPYANRTPPIAADWPTWPRNVRRVTCSTI